MLEAQFGRAATPSAFMTQTATSSATRPSLDLSAVCDGCGGLDALYKRDLLPGDWALVSTRNSEYLIGRGPDGRYLVSGGWFEANGSSPASLDVLGCTFGGHAIHTEILAAPGLFLEFEGGVKTTRIQALRHYHGAAELAVS